MEKLTKKEKQERLQKAKKVAHNVMHIVGYVSLGLLGLILCLTASKCSNAKTQDNVQVQEVARPYEKPQNKVDSTYTYVLDPNSNIMDVFDTDIDSEMYYYSGYYTTDLDSSEAFEQLRVNLVASNGELTITFFDSGGNDNGSLIWDGGVVDDIGGVVSITFDENPSAILDVLNAISVQPVTPTDNNEVIVSLGSAWTQAITGFAGVLASSVNSIVAIFYANNSLTFVGILLTIAMGVGVVYFAFRLIRNLIRNRG